MSVEYTKKALEHLTGLSADVRDRVANKIDFYAAQENPLEFSEHLTGFHIYRFRIGMYRVFFDIDEHTLVVLAIRKRDKAYRDLD